MQIQYVSGMISIIYEMISQTTFNLMPSSTKKKSKEFDNRTRQDKIGQMIF